MSDDEPAFPSGERFSIDKSGRRDDRISEPLHAGLTIRDYFASAALTGIVETAVTFGDAAREAYAHADAMLAERLRQQSEMEA